MSTTTLRLFPGQQSAGSVSNKPDESEDEGVLVSGGEELVEVEESALGGSWQVLWKVCAVP